MVAKRKLYARLDALEAQLEEELVPHLRAAARGENDLVFCVSAFNPFPRFRGATDRTTERLVAMGAEILALRVKLDEPADDDSPAARICWYCREWGNRESEQQNAAADLAQRFLAEVEDRHRG